MRRTSIRQSVLGGHPLRLLAAVLVLGAMASAARASGAAFVPEPTALEQQLADDAADGQLHHFTLIEAALIASGVCERPGVERYTAFYQQHLAAFEQQLGQQSPEDTVGTEIATRNIARAALAYVHDHVATGSYDARYTEIDRTLGCGDYNCVTATLLFCDLCRRHGIAAEAWAAPGHVFARVPLVSGDASSGESEVVETTCRGWFRRLIPAARAAAIAERRGGQHQSERQLSDIELVGKIIYNRGVFSLEEERYAEAIDYLQLSCRFDATDAAAQNNLLAAYNNWALAASEAGDWQQAAQLVRMGRALNEHYEPLQANQLHIDHGWATDLCRQHRYAEALAVLEGGYRQFPAAPLYDMGRFSIYRAWIEHLLQSGDRTAALDILARARQLDPQRASKLWQEIAREHT